MIYKHKITDKTVVRTKKWNIKYMTYKHKITDKNQRYCSKNKKIKYEVMMKTWYINIK
jgi:hypothetical protein